MSITDKRLNEIQERTEQTSKGPWTHDVTEFRNHMSNAVKAPLTDHIGTELVVIAHTGYGPGAPHRNASFMARARDDVPDLLAEVHRLRAELAKAREVTDEKVERVAGALAAHWTDGHTNEALGRQKVLARHALYAALGGGDDA